MALRACRTVIRKKVPQPTPPEAAGHVLLARIGAPQAGGHRQVDQRIDGKGHDQHRAPETVDPGATATPTQS